MSSTSRFLCRTSSLSSLVHTTHHQYRSLITSSFKSSQLLAPSYTNSIHHNNHYSISQHNKSKFCTKPPPPNTEENKEDVNEEEENEDEDESEWEYREVDDEAVRKRNFQPLTWRTVIGVMIIFGGGTIWFQQRLHLKKQKQKKPEYASYGEAQIGGGEWKMTDHNGQQIDQTTLQGKYQVVYFGFTFCPDVCPRELTKMARV